MIQYFINRAGKNLSPERKHELEKAKKILQAQRGEKNRMWRSHGTPTTPRSDGPTEDGNRKVASDHLRSSPQPLKNGLRPSRIVAQCDTL